MGLLKLLKEHWFYLLILFLLVILFKFPLLNLHNSYPSGGDWRQSHMGPIWAMQQSYEHGAIPFWTPAIQSGMSFLNPAFPVLYPPTLFFLMITEPPGVLNLTSILHLLLAAMGMYALAFYLLKDEKAALISSVLFSFSNFVWGSSSVIYWGIGMAYVPWIMLFVLQAMHAAEIKAQIGYSMVVSVLFALQLYGGGVFQFYFTFLMVLLYVLYVGITDWKKAALCAVVIVLFVFGLSAARLLPYQEFVQLTNRGEGVPLAEAMKNKLTLQNVFSFFVKGEENNKGQIGIIGLVLFGASFLVYRKKKDQFMLFLFILLALEFVYMTGIFHPLLWNILPGIKAQRGLDRSAFIFVFGAVLLAGYGFKALWHEKIASKQWPKKKEYLIVAALVLLILIDLFMLRPIYPEQVTYEDAVHNNNIVNYIAQDKGIFRFHSWEIRGIDYNNIQEVAQPLGLEMVYGMFAPLWETEYFHQYLGASFQSPAKLWGMLNVKYVTSAQQLNVSGLRFVQKFEETSDAFPQSADGPYLYQNDRFLPRAYVVNASILVIGESESAKQIMYSLMLFDAFEPSTTTIILGKPSVKSYSIQQLLQHNLIVLGPGSVDQYGMKLLEQYVKQGGTVFPDLTKGKQEASEAEISATLATLGGTFVEAPILEYYTQTPNHLKIDVAGKKGYLVISEKFPINPGWSCMIDSKPVEILRADGVLSAIQLDGTAQAVDCRYEPKSWKLAVWLTGLSFLIVIGYGCYLLFLRTKKPSAPLPQHTPQQP